MDATETVKRVLIAMADHDWETVGACVADDVVRIGPYRDIYRGRDAYVGFLAGVLPALAGYEMRIDRVMSAGPGVVVAELSEVVEVAGKSLATAEALVFDMALDGRIARIAVYTQNEPAG